MRSWPVALLIIAAAVGGAWADTAGHGGPIRGMAVSVDGSRVMTAGFDYSVVEWDIETIRPLRRLIGHDAAVNAVAYLPDGRAVSASDDRTLAIWRLADGVRLHVLAGHAAKVTSVAVAPDGARIASAGWDRTVRLWSGDGGALRVLEHRSDVNAVAFAPDGRLLATAGHDGKVTLWNAADGNRLLEFGHDGFPVTALSFAPDGRALITASADMAVRQWDVESGREIGAAQRHDSPVLALAVSTDGAIGVAGGLHGSVRVWRLSDSSFLRVIGRHGEPIWAVGLTPDGRRLLTAEADGGLHVWDVETGRHIGPESAIAAAAPAASDTSEGARLFRKCSVCHSVSVDGGGRAGPTLYGVFGRRAGSVAGYPYSPALRDSNLVWDEETIGELFEHGPEEMTPGSKMPLQRIPNPRERAALIAYLKQITAP